jgi:hypothetical protein
MNKPKEREPLFMICELCGESVLTRYIARHVEEHHEMQVPLQDRFHPKKQEEEASQ